MGITGFAAFLSTTFIRLLYKVDISVGMSRLLLSSGSRLNLLGLGQRFSSRQKIVSGPHVLTSLRASLFYHSAYLLEYSFPHSTFKLKMSVWGAGQGDAGSGCFGIKRERSLRRQVFKIMNCVLM